MEFPADHSK